MKGFLPSNAETGVAKRTADAATEILFPLS